MKKNAPIYIIIAVAIGLMIVHVMRLNFEDLSWDVNSTPYTGMLIVVAILIVAAYRLKSSSK